jgi:hypothetical protein
MDPIGMIVGLQLTRDHVTSALPNAPVVDDGRGASQRATAGGPLRHATARLLRGLAERVEPTRPAAPDPIACR